MQTMCFFRLVVAAVLFGVGTVARSASGQDLIADAAKDYARGANAGDLADNISDTAGSGKWVYGTSWTAGPMDSGNKFAVMKWDPTLWDGIYAGAAPSKPGTVGVPDVRKDSPEMPHLLWHPDYRDPKYAVVRWISGVRGKIKVAGVITRPDPHGDGVSVGIYQNGVLIYPEWLAAAEPMKFLVELRVKPGDKLDFVLGPRADSSYDTSTLEVKITRQPE